MHIPFVQKIFMALASLCEFNQTTSLWNDNTIPEQEESLTSREHDAVTLRKTLKLTPRRKARQEMLLKIFAILAALREKKNVPARKKFVPNCFTKKTNPHSLVFNAGSPCVVAPFIQETPPEQHATSALLHKNLCGLGGSA